MTTVAPAAACILSQATALWPNRSTASDGTIGDAAHAARVSDHNPDSRGIVHAADLTEDPAHGVDTRKLADQIRLRAKAGKEPRLKYIISFSRIASPTGGWEWRAYDGDPHENHLHASVNSGAIENDTSPWFTDESEFTVAEAAEIIKLLKDIDDKLPGLKQQERDRHAVNALVKDVDAIKRKLAAG